MYILGWHTFGGVGRGSANRSIQARGTEEFQTPICSKTKDLYKIAGIEAVISDRQSLENHNLAEDQPFWRSCPTNLPFTAILDDERNLSKLSQVGLIKRNDESVMRYVVGFVIGSQGNWKQTLKGTDILWVFQDKPGV